MQHRFAFLIAAPCLVLGLTACNNAIIVELQTGPQTFDVSASALGLPAGLRDDSGGSPRVASVDCSMSGICPGTADVPITCNGAGVCDPDAITIAVPVGDVVDFDALLQSAGTLLRLVDGIEIESVSYDVNPNTLNTSLPAVTVLWGAASATETSSSLQVLGTIPALAASTSASGMMDIDPDGSANLGDYIVHTSRMVRFFARTQVDLAPGDPFPDGMAHIVVNVRVRAIGRIVN